MVLSLKYYELGSKTVILGFSAFLRFLLLLLLLLLLRAFYVGPFLYTSFSNNIAFLLTLIFGTSSFRVN